MARTERGATQEAVRRHNLATLLGHLHRYGPTSQARLTKLLGLNRATIGALVDELVARGLVAEAAEPERGNRGRPSKVVAVRSDTVAVVAVEIGVDAIRLALVSLGGLVIDGDREALLTDSDREFGRVVDAVARLATQLMARSLGDRIPVGMGVAVPGAVSPGGSMVSFAPNLGWRCMPLGDRLHDALGGEIVVRVGNDANLGAMAEHSRGVASGVNDLAYLHAEVGVGGGIITAGQMLEGSRGYGGEVGHMQVNPYGVACHCGSRGCWETEAGEGALVRRAGLPAGGQGAVEVVLQRARDGDPTCLAAVETTARWISAGLVNLVNSLNPEMLILGGMFEDIFELAEPTLVEQLRVGVYDSEQLPVAVVRPKFGRDAVLVGAAELALQVILLDPAVLPMVVSGEPAVLGTVRPAPVMVKLAARRRPRPALRAHSVAPPVSSRSALPPVPEIPV
ncbi:MAG: ROK family transcriptional regulator [Candidatus Dormibacteria bacterium]